MLAAAGLDFVIFNMEHGRCDLALAAEMLASCRGSDIVPLVRATDLGAVSRSRMLDLGACGVMIPRLETRSQIQDGVAQLKSAPEGRRGVALGIAHDLYRPKGAEYFAQANADTMIIAILETVRGFEDLENRFSAGTGCALDGAL
jgi:2-dehydro-3-deoxyglucarate aldolase/4-hydroxy-2-oxoheptanedioate aldolase